MDRPVLRRLLDHVTAHRVRFCVVATRDRLSEGLEHMADISQALDDELNARFEGPQHDARSGISLAVLHYERYINHSRRERYIRR